MTRAALLLAAALLGPLPASAESADGATARETVAVPAPARRIERGEVIVAGDLKTVEIDARRARDTMIRDAELAVGMEARRTLLPGRPMSQVFLRKPLMVTRESQVTAVYADGALQLTLLALSQDDGHKGDTVRLTNLDTGATVYAVVTGPARVRIGAQE